MEDAAIDEHYNARRDLDSHQENMIRRKFSPIYHLKCVHELGFGFEQACFSSLALLFFSPIFSEPNEPIILFMQAIQQLGQVDVDFAILSARRHRARLLFGPFG
jgi:hypothetical protein